METTPRFPLKEVPNTSLQTPFRVLELLSAAATSSRPPVNPFGMEPYQTQRTSDNAWVIRQVKGAAR